MSAGVDAGLMARLQNTGLLLAVGLLVAGISGGAFANPAKQVSKTERGPCPGLRDRVQASERAARETVRKIKAAPTKALWCSYNQDYSSQYQQHNELMRDFARCRHLEEQGADYNQLIAEYEFNKQRLVGLKGTLDVACAVSDE